ncbi:PadR family transcriptional regulator [Novosphingobium sp.]|uniref:PadR family transcriptional regulator n=1 Tax=Novosphingobium sp. TaxID=1874826 RepID=UPI00286C8068|nr:PadR family transcriptional regulator [Novosphingobium sp.]
MRMHGCGHHGRHGKGAMIAMMTGGWGRHRGSGWGSDFGDDFGTSQRGRGPRGRARMFGSGELRLVLLGLVGEAPRHGYELIKAIEELSGGNYAPSPGVVYPTLNLLTDEGLIGEQEGSGTRKSFEITAAGRSELDTRIDEFKAIISRLTALAQDDERHSAPPLKRAMGNLFMAVRQRMTGSGFERETMHQIAEILDEAARKIERL